MTFVMLISNVNFENLVKSKNIREEIVLFKVFVVLIFASNVNVRERLSKTQDMKEIVEYMKNS